MDAYLPERLALTGGTGALGLAFLQRIFQQQPGLQATLLVRRSSASFQATAFQSWLRKNEDRVTLIEGDIRHLGSHQIDALLACDGGLWHFAALTSLTAESDEIAKEIHAVNFEGTQHLAEAFIEAKTGHHFYHISTAYIAGERDGLSLETETRMKQTFRNPYEASKLAAETCLHRAFAAGVPGTIFRPSVVVDDAGGTGGIKMVDACAYAVALAFKRGEPFIFRMSRETNINLIHSDWVVAAMIDLARNPSGSGRTYHLTSPLDTYFRDIAVILEQNTPTLKVSFEPDLPRTKLPLASRIFEKAVTEIRPYFEANIHFDRTNTDQDLSPAMRGHAFDLRSFVQNRFKAELGRVLTAK